MTFLSIIISALLAFGLGDIVDIIEDDDVQSALDIAESFDRANRDITEVEEYYLGRSVAATVLNMYVPLENPALQQYVNLVGQTVACSSPKPTLFGGYHFLVMNSTEINAIACPGGFILICSGLIDLASNEDELAAILAHEVSHVALSHGILSIDQARWTEFGILVANESAERSGINEVQAAAEDYGELVEDVVSNIITKGYSQETEFQADSLAAEICANAGYDPCALASILQTMSAIDSRSGPGFWQTHPSPEDRITAINAVIATLPQSQVDPVRTARFDEYTSGSVIVQDTGSGTTGTGSRGSTGSTGGRGSSGSSGSRP
ncbi:MAG: M48 family metalloprotease [Candidatus Aegiribacteria sp.]|nr:M48 family metalloprotease [Candidatus Aegiribacteria sp.]